MKKTLFYITLAVLIVLLYGVGSVLAAAPRASRAQAALDTAFTYQGQLKQGDEPVTGTCDFHFSLWDALEDGTQISSTLDTPNAAVANGRFSVTLDFGANAFAGDGRFLEIAVRCPAGSGDYATLAPRRELTAVPYALYSQAASTSDSAATADSAPWSGLTGVPAGFADGVDDGTAYTAGTGLLLAGTEFSADTSFLQQRVGSACGEGYAIRQVNADGSVVCEQDGNTTYTAGNGLTLFGTEFSVLGAPWSGLWGVPLGFLDGIDNDTTYTPGFGLILAGTTFTVTGAPWSGLTGVPADFSDGVDNDTTYTAGTGLALLGSQFSLLSSFQLPQSCPAGRVPWFNGEVWWCHEAQDRVTGTCGAGYSIRQINIGGDVVCEQDDNTTDHGALTGLGEDDHPQYFNLNQNETVSGIPAFNGGATGSTAPFTVDSTFVVTNLNADLLDGQSGSYYSNWNNLTNVPAGFSDGIDNDTAYSAGTGLNLTGTTFSVTGAPWSGLTGMPAGFADSVDDNTIYTASDGLTLAGTQFSMAGTSYANVVIVAKSGGDYATIQAALDSITDAADGNRYLVWVAPGLYSERVTMKPFVNIQGSGISATRITYSGSSSANTGTVVGSGNAEIRDLTIESLGGNTYAIGMYNEAMSPRVANVNIAIAVAGLGVSSAYGMHNVSSAVSVTNSTISVSGGTGSNTGIYNYNSTPAVLSNLSITVSGTASRGIYNNQSSMTLRNSYVDGGLWGIANTLISGYYTVSIQNSQISGSTNAVYSSSPSYTVRIGGSYLVGGPVSGGTTTTCAGVYDENYVFSASMCP